MRGVVLIVAILACPACHKQPGTAAAIPEKSAAAAEPAAKAEEPATPTGAAKEPASRAEEIFDVLTAHSWTGRAPNPPAFPPMDYSVASFRADGTWSHEFFTDYHIPAKTGKWNLQLLEGEWFLCQDDGGRGPIATNDDGTITLRSGKLYPHEPLKREPEQTAAKLPKLTLISEVQEIVRRLTAHTWKRANDLDLFMEPTQVRFGSDWKYIGTYRGGECKSEGTWYAKIDEIVGHSPKGRCDRPSDTSTGDWITAKVIDDRKILVNWDLYVPEDEPVKRGIVWNLSGFDAAVVRVEYDMPIRRGQPVRFDVTITNGSIWPIKLERFSLSRGYSDYSRSLGVAGRKPVPPEDELAAHDLAGMTLEPSKSHTFGLSAEFPDAGKQWVYFNALISGTSQNWDTHQAHELTAAD